MFGDLCLPLVLTATTALRNRSDLQLHCNYAMNQFVDSGSGCEESVFFKNMKKTWTFS